jgi:radical SAM protein with 4Fe4S-binding SPASM domain
MEMNNVIAVVRSGFSQVATRTLPDTPVITYDLGDPFSQVWEQAVASDREYILLVDNAVPLPGNMYRLLCQLLRANRGADGITLDTAALTTVYGFPVCNNGQAAYPARKIPTLPAWLALLKTAKWQASSMLTPEFFLLEQSDGKHCISFKTQDIRFDSFRWAGSLIGGAIHQLAADYQVFSPGNITVPPQFRVTIPGRGKGPSIAARGIGSSMDEAPANPTFSIICPSIRPEFLAEAIESALAQQYPYWELWIGVDGPKETIRRKIQQVVEPYTRDPRVKVLYCNHMGTGPMRKFLSQQGNSDYIVGLDDDDRLMPNALQRFAGEINAMPDTVILRAGIQLFGLLEAQLPARTRYQINGISNDLFEANQPYAVKRTTLESVGGLEWDKDLKNAGEDSDLLLKADREKFRLTILQEPLYERRLSTFNQTLDCTAEACLKHVHNLYNKHNPPDWTLKEVDMTGQGATIGMLTRHESAENAVQVVCSTEFMDFQQVGSREGVVLDLEITSLCNADCVFCPREKLVREGRFMSLETAGQIAASLHNMRSPTVVLCGIGESTLHPQLDQIITLLAKAGANTCMTTNGWALSAENVDKLVSAGLSELNVSLNAASADTHQRVMRLKHFETICATCEQIARLRSTRWPSLKFHVSFVVTADNIHEVGAFVARWRPTDVTMIWLHKLTNRAGQLAKRVMPVDMAPIIATYAGDPRILVDMFPGSKVIGNLCHIADRVDFISVEGDMLLCAQDYGATHRFGNIAYEDLGRLHHNKLLRHLRGETRSTCSKCSFCPDCFKSGDAGSYSIVEAKEYSDGLELIQGPDWHQAGQ